MYKYRLKCLNIKVLFDYVLKSMQEPTVHLFWCSRSAYSESLLRCAINLCSIALISNKIQIVSV